MAAFGGAGGASNPNGGFGSGVSPVSGAAAQAAANPWDMGGLDPLPLLGPNNMQVVRGGRVNLTTAMVINGYFRLEQNPRAQWKIY